MYAYNKNVCVYIIGNTELPDNSSISTRVASVSAKGSQSPPQLRNPNSAPILVSCLERRARRMRMKLQKQLRFFPAAHAFLIFRARRCAPRTVGRAPGVGAAPGDEWDPGSSASAGLRWRLERRSKWPLGDAELAFSVPAGFTHPPPRQRFPRPRAFVG